MKAINKKILIGIVASAAVVGVILWVIFRKKNAESDTETEPVTGEDPATTVEPPYISNPDPVVLDPVQDPDPEPEPVPVGSTAPDPLAPLSDPEKGQYYAVVKGDTMLGICGRAGYTSTEKNQAYRAMLHATENAWIGSKTDDNDWEVLRFNQRFAATPGYEDQPWAWSTEYVPNTQGKWPVVYVPTDDELSA